ncbi:MAG: diacylglycerol kinase family protein [Flavobacteriaceae bacterium]|nr:diacylglycerol kinase family protein [Flavobacteriaceae bacterium]
MEKSEKGNFVKGRLKSVRYAAKGGWILLTTEHSIIAQLIIGIIMMVVGFSAQLTTTEWLFQIFAIGLVVVAEAANTSIEYLCDFIHPEYHKKIGFIKDIAAGIPFLAAIFSIIIGLIIYIPKIII